MNKFNYMRVNSYYYIKYDEFNMKPDLCGFIKDFVVCLGYFFYSLLLIYMIKLYFEGICETFFGCIINIALQVISLFYLNYLRSINFTKLILNIINLFEYKIYMYSRKMS